MNRYEMLVSMIVMVDAPSESDAREAVSDAFDVGEFCGLDVKEVESNIVGVKNGPDRI